MLPEKGKKEIPLVLTNSSALASSTINLFSLGNLTSGTNSGATASGQQISILNTDFTGVNWRFFYNGGLIFSITAPLNIDILITSLNTQFKENGQGIFWKEVDPIGDWILKTASSVFIFLVATRTALPTKTFTSFTGAFISGTSIEVSMGANVTYNEVSVELNSQPYIITTVYVYCPTQSQLAKPFIINKIDRNGTSSVRPFKPQLSPDQEQNVQMEIPIYMTTSNQNQLQYTLEASGTATMIVQYQNIGLVDALQLIQSGEFQYQMAVLKKQDEIEYKRIMDIVNGAEVVEEMQQSKDWNKVAFNDIYSDPPKPTNPQEIKYLVVPLIYVVAKENGIKDFLML